MKLAIPVEQTSLDVPVCISFGRSPFFAVVAVESGLCEFVANAAAAGQGGAGIKAAQLLADAGVEAVITFRCGENAAAVLGPAGAALYRAVAGTASENLEKFKAGELSILSEIHPGFHKHGPNGGK